MERVVALLLILSTPAFADPDNVALAQGQAAPYAGILFPVARAQRVQLMSIDLDTCTKRLNLANENESIFQQRTDNLVADNTRLYEEKTNPGFFSTPVGGFVLGLGSAIAMAWAISRVTR